jgi:hypothetical protein
MEDQIVVTLFRRNAAETEIAKWMAGVERRIAFHLHAAGADQCQASPRTAGFLSFASGTRTPFSTMEPGYR